MEPTESSSSPAPPRKVQILLKIGEKQYRISMDPTGTVLQLKEKIHEVEGLPLNRFNLSISFMGTDLMAEDRFLLRDYAQVNVVVKPSVSASASPSPSPSAPTTATGNTSRSSKKPSVSVSVSASASPSAPTTATGNTSRSSMKLKLMVLPTVGSKILVEVNASDKVGELKKELQKLQNSHPNLPTESYFFIHKQGLMEEDRSFRWHGVNQGDTIEIFPGTVTRGE